MNFKEKYPQPLRIALFASGDVEVEERITYTGMVYSCVVCKDKTGYYVTLSNLIPSVPCCSDECKEAALKLAKEVGDYDELVLKVPEQPFNPFGRGDPRTTQITEADEELLSGEPVQIPIMLLQIEEDIDQPLPSVHELPSD